MRRLVTTTLLASVLLGGCATFDHQVMAPWKGATEAELLAVWGPPQSTQEAAGPDAATKVHTYTSFNGEPCQMTFTVTDGVVTDWARKGGACLGQVR